MVKPRIRFDEYGLVEISNFYQAQTMKEYKLFYLTMFLVLHHNARIKNKFSYKFKIMIAEILN